MLFFLRLLKSLIRDLFQPYQNFIFVGGRFGQIGSVIIGHMEKMKEGGEKSIKTQFYRKTIAHVCVISAALIKLH